MELRISSKLHAKLLAIAAASPAIEVCGLLVGRDRVEHIIAAANVAPDPRRCFEIDPKVLFAALRVERAGGDKVLGYYHSHPTGSPTPSATDTAHATVDGRIWLIIVKGRAAAWALNETRVFDRVDYQISD